MTSLIKFELGKILRNRTVFGGIVVGCLVLLGIFFVGYHYSQLSMSELGQFRFVTHMISYFFFNCIFIEKIIKTSNV